MKNPITITAHPPIYPYLITRVSPAFYHVIVLSHGSTEALIEIALSQESCNDLPTCLVLSKHTAKYFANGKEYAQEPFPAGSTLITERLKPCFDVQESLEKDPSYAIRQGILADFIDRQSKDVMFGDLTRGARPATAEELTHLSGVNPAFASVPNGLAL